MKIISQLSVIFIIGGTLGWLNELIFRRIVHKKWVNPGFLTGPCLPLYGCGLLLLYLISSIDFSFISSPVLQMEFNETEQELEIEEYLNDTYNLTKALNRRKENKNGISKTK